MREELTWARVTRLHIVTAIAAVALITRDRVAWFDPAQAGMALLGDNLHAPDNIQAFLDRAGVAPPTGPWASRK